MSKSAIISHCGKYRYRLDRMVSDSGPVYAFFGVNPSTADASVDDATVRKWRGFVQRWGGSRFIVGNVFAYRATDVNELATAVDPFGDLIGIHSSGQMIEVTAKLPPNLPPNYFESDPSARLAEPHCMAGLTRPPSPSACGRFRASAHVQPLHHAHRGRNRALGYGRFPPWPGRVHPARRG